ncbi:MAG: flagellar filament capping protein FliD [Planctomycetota bacterium]|jgi:flagellar hook-associated protein 2|nr:flagellar filament capping protein FliD [Blastopirellula sp.]
MSFSIDGLISGLNTSSIIDSMVKLQANQVNRLNEQKQQVVNRQTSFKGVEARLLSLRSSLSRLNRVTSSVFDARTASVSDESIVSAAAGSGAQVGSFSLKVNALAAAEKRASSGFAAATSTITQGTLDIRVGNRESTTITIDASNNTASGLVTAINAQAKDVTAALVKDQASGQFKVLLSSKYTGESNTISITNNLAASSGGAVQPDFTGAVVQAAGNASITIGSGAGAITSVYETNRIDDLVDGVSLNLLKADASKEVTVSVGADNEGVVTAVGDFVKEFNGVIQYISEQSQFIVQSQKAGPLLGNRSVSEIQNQLRSIAIGSVPGLETAINRLSRVGVGVSSNGTLTFDESKLRKALSGELSGVSARDVQRLFGLSAESTAAGVEFLLGSSRTKSSTTPYQVDITQAAEQATISSSGLGGTIVIAPGQNTFSFKLDGKESGTLSLTAGTYTPAQLATQLESVINSATSLGSRKVTASIEGGQLRLTSQAYGSNSKIEELGGTALTVLGFSGSESDVGADVVGRFMVNGQIETAKGTGRLLMGDANNVNTADLQVRVTLTAAQVTAGVEANLTVTRGVTADLEQYLTKVLDPVKGQVKNGNESFQSQIDAFDASIKRVNEVAEAKRASLVAQFANLERLLSDLQQTGSFISGQLTGLSNLNNSRRN